MLAENRPTIEVKRTRLRRSFNLVRDWPNENWRYDREEVNPREVLRKTAIGAAKVIRVTLRLLVVVLEAMFDGRRIVREVGPGKRPQERYEFEKNHDLFGRGRF